MRRWHAAIAWALVGGPVEVDETGDGPDPRAVSGELITAGWDTEALSGHAADTLAAGQPWPHPVPAGLRTGLGAAQLAAAIAATRRHLGVADLLVRPPSRRTRLNADELRLLREVPPHHGS